MSDDITHRLRQRVDHPWATKADAEVMMDAAFEIEDLRAEVERLKAELS